MNQIEQIKQLQAQVNALELAFRREERRADDSERRLDDMAATDPSNRPEVEKIKYDPDLDNELHKKERAALQPVAQVAEPVKLRFPTMLRKMWSGGEVQDWLDTLPRLFSSEPR